jgi:hypothetical protein
MQASGKYILLILPSETEALVMSATIRGRLAWRKDTKAHNSREVLVLNFERADRAMRLPQWAYRPSEPVATITALEDTATESVESRQLSSPVRSAVLSSAVTPLDVAIAASFLVGWRT